MTDINAAASCEVSRRRNIALVGAAVHRHRLFSKSGMSERAFTFAFSTLVYPQIWEDPVVDAEALALEPDHHVVTIASGGCNILSYLTVAPVKITAVDLNTAHVALNRLKLACTQYLPDHKAFYQFFGDANTRENIRLYDDLIKHRLDPEVQAYWNGREVSGRRRIERFARGFYRYGLLGRFIATGHGLAKLLGGNPRAMLKARTLAEQRQIYDRELKPLFAKPMVRRILDQRSALFGLGIPPAQYDALSGGRPMHEVVEERLEKLACDTPLSENYFAWQAFNRGYASGGEGPVPPYLEARHFETLRANARRVEIRHQSYTDYLASLPAASADRYVLLDAQDWMADADLTELWQEITRTSRPGARVIFRTAGIETILPGRVPHAILSQWDYQSETSTTLGAKDRSAIYGGFHLYIKAA